MSAPIFPGAIRTDTSRASIDFADPGAGEIRIVKADGLRGSLGLYEVTANDKTELLTRDEIEQRNLLPGGGSAPRFGAPPEQHADDAQEKSANPAATNPSPSDADVVSARRNVARTTRVATRTAEQLDELGKWPQKAHAEWKDLTQMERIAVFESMQKRYGESFARQFLQFTKSGARDDGAYYGPQLAEQTPQSFADRGFKLAQRDSELDWWVHPSGKSVTVDRERSKSGAPVAPPVDAAPACGDDHSAELLRMTREIVDQEIESNAALQARAIELKAGMDRMNVTSPQFADAYQEYVALLDDASKQAQDQIESLAATREALAAMGCDEPELASAGDQLAEQFVWFQSTRDLLEMDMRKPIDIDFR